MVLRVSPSGGQPMGVIHIVFFLHCLPPAQQGVVLE